MKKLLRCDGEASTNNNDYDRDDYSSCTTTNKQLRKIKRTPSDAVGSEVGRHLVGAG